MLREEELLALVRGLDVVELRRWVESGWVRPQRENAVCFYREIDMARVRLIREMREEMQIDEEGIPVVLSLLDQIYGLRRALRQLVGAIDAQPEPVRRDILHHWRASPAEEES
jgi:chaperone modulatory protein CbpM